MGHLGNVPQSVREEGGYRVKGKLDVEREHLVRGAQALADVGAFAIVLELVSPAAAKAITRRRPKSHIGIGSARL